MQDRSVEQGIQQYQHSCLVKRKNNSPASHSLQCGRHLWCCGQNCPLEPAGPGWRSFACANTLISLLQRADAPTISTSHTSACHLMCDCTVDIAICQGAKHLNLLYCKARQVCVDNSPHLIVLRCVGIHFCCTTRSLIYENGRKNFAFCRFLLFLGIWFIVLFCYGFSCCFL